LLGLLQLLGLDLAQSGGPGTSALASLLAAKQTSAPMHSVLSQLHGLSAMVRILDEADYRRRADAAIEISTGEEAGLLLKGIFTGDSFGPLNARLAIGIAKQEALRKARKEMLKAIRAEDDRIRNGAIIPIDVQEIVTGSSDELVQVP
jgi:hypothetical protein